MVMDKYAPRPRRPLTRRPLRPLPPVRTTKNASMKPIKTASNTARPGKPLNILMR